MTPRAVGFAVRLVRLWTRAYTFGLPADVRAARFDEIDCDLWECQHDAERAAGSIEIVTRLLLGMPHDLLWRLELTADTTVHNAAPARRAVTVSAFTCSFTLHLIALAAAVWWASWPADRADLKVGTTTEGPALLVAAPLAVSESEWPARYVPSEEDHAMKKAALLIGTVMTFRCPAGRDGSIPIGSTSSPKPKMTCRSIKND